MASGDTLGGAILWDVSRRKRLATLTGNQGEIDRMAFSPDGRLLVFNDFPARRVRLWDVERRRRLASLATPSPVSGIAFSSDGDQLAIGSVDGSIRLRGATTAAWLRHLCRMVDRDITRAEWSEFVVGVPYRRGARSPDDEFCLPPS